MLNGSVPAYNVNATSPFTLDQPTLGLRMFVVGPTPSAMTRVTIADGADSTQCATSDAAWDGMATSPTQQAILKALTAKILSGTVKTDGSDVTQSVSTASLPLPSAAATAANQSNEVAALQVANSRALIGADFNGTVAAGSTGVSTIRSPGAA